MSQVTWFRDLVRFFRRDLSVDDHRSVGSRTDLHLTSDLRRSGAPISVSTSEPHAGWTIREAKQMDLFTRKTSVHRLSPPTESVTH